MKTPEQYLRAAMHEVKMIDLDYSKQAARLALKSMQEDAEKELIEFAEWHYRLGTVDRISVHSADGGVSGPRLKTTQELLTQFRNKG